MKPASIILKTERRPTTSIISSFDIQAKLPWALLMTGYGIATMSPSSLTLICKKKMLDWI
jgi:hypothetical protein